MQEEIEQVERDEPLSREILDDPQIKKQIDEAKERIREGKTGRGKSAEDLLNLAREQRGMDSRSGV